MKTWRETINGHEWEGFGRGERKLVEKSRETKGCQGKYVSRSTHDCITAYAEGRGPSSEDRRSGKWPEKRRRGERAKFEFSLRRDTTTRASLRNSTTIPRNPPVKKRERERNSREKKKGTGAEIRREALDSFSLYGARVYEAWP